MKKALIVMAFVAAIAVSVVSCKSKEEKAADALKEAFESLM